MNASELYVKEIKENLNNNHAAVLVGSGFSMNARRLDGSTTHMPDWFGLADVFSEKLGVDPLDSAIRYANPLTLAQQVVEVYGRPYMNTLLRDLMDDEAYAPGYAHELLISLPWTDIFTTNYDTLLERAYQDGTKRRYKVIYNQDDLLYSAGTPRIVKLHGSFPSHEPFIISEEDYRRYPQDFAPFVNTVQQSLLENLFVLIGFSGSDPNFLKWIGWIHDNLGTSNSPRIYMIVHKPESEVTKKMLAAKNIDIVVLNDIPHYRSDSYKLSLEKFLDDLDKHVIRNSKGRSWPQFFPHSFDATPKQVHDEISAIHISYPGWITARYKCIKMSQHLIADFEFFIRKIGNKEGPSDDELELEIDICDKFSWLCNITGCFVSQYTVKALKKILERHLDKEKSDAFIRIELFILKNCRLSGDKGWFEVYKDIKEKIRKTGLWNDLYVELTYEYAMHLMYSFKWENLEDAVRMIPCDEEHGEWILRKAGLLSMLGYHKEALGLLQDGIEYARKILLRTDKGDTRVYNRFSSLESCMIALLRYIQQTYDIAMGRPFVEESNEDDSSEIDVDNKEENLEGGENKGNKNRREINYEGVMDYVNDYIWDLENEKFLNCVSDSYKPRPSVTHTPTFDIDRISENRNFGGDNEGLNAMQFLLFREATGQPFHIGAVSNKDGVLGTISRLNWTSHRASIVLALLVGENKAIETALTRMALADMEVQEIDCMTNELVDLMSYCLNYVTARSKASIFDSVIQDYILSVAPEAISRLIVKCSSGIYKRIVELAIKIYDIKPLDLSIDAKHLIDRTVRMMPYKVFEELLGELWKIDIKSDNPHFNSNFPDPFYEAHVKVLTFRGEHVYDMENSQVELFREWIEKAKKPDYRNSAISRLSYIYRMYKLPEELTNSLKNLIWAKDNLDEYGLPNLGIFFKVIATDYPHDRDDDEIMDAAERYVIDAYMKYINNQTMTNFTDLFRMTETLIERIDIDETKCKNGLQLSLKFCEMLDKHKEPGVTFGFFDAKHTFDMIDGIVGFMILKSGMASKDKSYSDETVAKIIDILDGIGSPHALLSWCSSSVDRYYGIVSSVLKPDPTYTRNANQAMYRLINAGVDVDKRIVDLMSHSVATTLAYNVNSYALGLEHLVRRGLLDDVNLKLISESLKKFDEITKIDILDDDEDVIRKTGMREVISLLARTIYKRCEKDGKPIPEGIEYWKKLSNEPEEFAEIRIVWDMDLKLG